MRQLTHQILMIRPAHFGYNEETAVNNVFQQKADEQQSDEIQKKAIEEFDNMVGILITKGIQVLVIQDSSSPIKPDAVFPNNWISLHENGTVITYPMFAKNRRIERSNEILETISSQFHVKNKYSFDFYEEENEFLEGTGSLIFDRKNSIVYACLSQRTHVTLIDKFNLLMNTQSIVFFALDQKGFPIYHTNVMMALGEDFVVICMESVQNEENKKALIESFSKTGKEIIEISYAQMDAFAGNMLEVKNKFGERYLVMSETAYHSLNEDQIHRLSQRTNILSIPIPTIEKYGGGSVRCMMAENFLSPK